VASSGDEAHQEEREARRWSYPLLMTMTNRGGDENRPEEREGDSPDEQLSIDGL